jgi:hypothetical protein
MITLDLLVVIGQRWRFMFFYEPAFAQLQSPVNRYRAWTAIEI